VTGRGTTTRSPQKNFEASNALDAVLHSHLASVGVRPLTVDERTGELGGPRRHTGVAGRSPAGRLGLLLARDMGGAGRATANIKGEADRLLDICCMWPAFFIKVSQRPWPALAHLAGYRSQPPQRRSRTNVLARTLSPTALECAELPATGTQIIQSSADRHALATQRQARPIAKAGMRAQWRAVEKANDS
jgi:hypothetical protein